MDDYRMNRQIERVKRLADEGEDDELVSPENCQSLDLMWQFALDGLAIMGEPVIESGLSRHVESVERRQR